MSKTRTMLIFVIAGAVTFTTGLWLYSTKAELSVFDYGTAFTVFGVVVFSIFIASKRLKEEKLGLPSDDELSSAIKQKAAATAFTLSFYVWLFILMFTMDKDIQIEIPIGSGILGMGVVFIASWIYYSNKGIGNENQD